MEFATDIEVRFSETDKMGVVYHSNYFSWFDVARCKLLEEIGFPYNKVEEMGYMCPVVDAHITYGLPFRFGETATVYTRVSKTTQVRTTYSYRIFLKGEDPTTTKPHLTGYTTHCVVDSDNFKPTTLKRSIPGLFEKYNEIVQPEA